MIWIKFCESSQPLAPPARLSPYYETWNATTPPETNGLLGYACHGCHSFITGLRHSLFLLEEMESKINKVIGRVPSSCQQLNLFSRIKMTRTFCVRNIQIP